MYVNLIHAGRIALARTLVSMVQGGRGSAQPLITRPRRRMRFGGRPSLFRRLTRLLNPAPVKRGGVAQRPDPMTFIDCAGRPYLIGAGTFLVTAYLQSHLQADAPSDPLKGTSTSGR